MSRLHGRRRFLATVAAGLGGAAASGTATAHTDGLQRAPLHAQLQTVAAATRPYAHAGKGVQRAVADGYEVLGPVVPGMGFHLVDFEAIGDHLDLRRPEALTVHPDGTLGGVEYLEPLEDGHDHDDQDHDDHDDRDHDDHDDRDHDDHDDHEHAATPDLFDDEDADVAVTEAEGWHPHGAAQHVFATPDDEVDDAPSLAQLLDPGNWAELVFDPDDHHGVPFPPAVEGLAPGDELTVDWGHDGTGAASRVVDRVHEHDPWNTLHVWVHAENPDGVFAGENPAFVPLPE